MTVGGGATYFMDSLLYRGTVPGGGGTLPWAGFNTPYPITAIRAFLQVQYDHDNGKHITVYPLVWPVNQPHLPCVCQQYLVRC